VDELTAGSITSGCLSRLQIWAPPRGNKMHGDPNYEWLVLYLDDLRASAVENEMPKLALSLSEAISIARREILELQRMLPSERSIN